MMFVKTLFFFIETLRFTPSTKTLKLCETREKRFKGYLLSLKLCQNCQK